MSEILEFYCDGIYLKLPKEKWEEVKKIMDLILEVLGESNSSEETKNV